MRSLLWRSIRPFPWAAALCREAQKSSQHRRILRNLHYLHCRSFGRRRRLGDECSGGLADVPFCSGSNGHCYDDSVGSDFHIVPFDAVLLKETFESRIMQSPPYICVGRSELSFVLFWSGRIVSLFDRFLGFYQAMCCFKEKS